MLTRNHPKLPARNVLILTSAFALICVYAFPITAEARKAGGRETQSVRKAGKDQQECKAGKDQQECRKAGKDQQECRKAGKDQQECRKAGKDQQECRAGNVDATYGDLLGRKAGDENTELVIEKTLDTSAAEINHDRTAKQPFDGYADLLTRQDDKQAKVETLPALLKDDGLRAAPSTIVLANDNDRMVEEGKDGLAEIITEADENPDMHVATGVLAPRDPVEPEKMSALDFTRGLADKINNTAFEVPQINVNPPTVRPVVVPTNAAPQAPLPPTRPIVIPRS